MDREREKNQAELAAEVRDRGIQPARDLWPEIAAKIGGTVGGEQVHRAPSAATSWWRRPVVRRGLAAAVVLVAAIWGVTQLTGPEAETDLQAPVLVDNTSPIGSGTPTVGAEEKPVLPVVPADGIIRETSPLVADDLATIDMALAEIKDALQLDPGNNALNHLRQKFQQLRGSLVCRLIL